MNTAKQLAPSGDFWVGLLVALIIMLGMGLEGWAIIRSVVQ